MVLEKLLEKFSEMGISQSLLSAAKQKMLEDLMKYHKLEKYFIKISGLDNHYANSKVDIGRSWINELQFEPNEILLIGDTIHDVEVADEIGTKCVLIAQGHATYDRLIASGRRVFNNLYEFKGWFIKQ